MENIKTYEEWSLFKNKELTPEEEYTKQKAKAEKSRQKFGFYTKTGDDVHFGHFTEENEEEEKKKRESEFQSSLKKLKDNPGSIDPYGEENWDVATA